MDHSSCQCIRQTFARLKPMAGLTALLFYKHLFAVAPQLQRLFTGNIEEQGRKLMDMLSTIVDCLDHPRAMEPALRDMGLRHAGYGVEAAHYEIVGLAMLDAFADVLGEAFNSNVRAAWAGAYDWIATVMKAGASAGDTGHFPHSTHQCP